MDGWIISIKSITNSMRISIGFFFFFSRASKDGISQRNNHETRRLSFTTPRR